MASNLTNGIPPKPYGHGGRYVVLPQAANAQIYQGAMVASVSATDAALVTGSTSGSGPICGVAVFDQLGGATDGAVRMQIWTDKVFCFAAGVLAPTDLTPFGTVLYAETDNTVGTGAPGQVIAGRFFGFEDDGTIRVYISSCASWFDTNANANDGGTSPFKCRAVVTTLQAYGGSTTGILTETANGAISAADGVTLAVGDVVFIQEGTTNLTAASDAGPYMVTALGGASAKWVLTRPSWWQTGAAIQESQVIDASGEGTLYAGTSWRAFCGKGQIVDTNDPVFWVREVTQSITLAAGTAIISNVGIRSASKSNVFLTRTATGGTVTSTIAYCPTAAGANGITAGALGTGSVVVQATVAAGTIANADTSTLAATVFNW